MTSPFAPPLPPSVVTVEIVEEEAADAWNGRDATQRLGAFLTPWERETTEHGAQAVSARVLGQHAEEAMVAFANGMGTVVADVKPTLDYSEDGIVACVWRRAGVWVRLWARDTATASKAPTPLSMPAKAPAPPSGRLPYRRNTTTCGNTRSYTQEN